MWDRAVIVAASWIGGKAFHCKEIKERERGEGKKSFGRQFKVLESLG
jgi:hypothetical protein